MEVTKPSYYAIIPAPVRYDKRLVGKAALLYGEITALTNKKGYCWATDGYFERVYDTGSTTIQKWLKSLEDCGYISRKVIYEEGSKRIKARYIMVNPMPSPDPMPEIGHTPMPEIGHTPMPEIGGTPMPEIGRENITSINNINNIVEQAQQLEDPKPKKQNRPSFYKEVIDYLNIKTGKSYNYKASSNQKMIRARQREGYSLDDFKRVIDTKSAEWSNSETMAKYLRPATLFSNKFDTYLNQKPVNKASQKNWSTNQDVKYQSEQYYRDLGL